MRRTLTIAATLVALVAGGGCGGQQNQADGASSAPSASATSASPTPSPTPSPTLSPTPSFSPSPIPPPKPTPAWIPCDNALESYEGGCNDDFLTGDTCDAAYTSSTDGSLIDAFIENKDYVNEGRLKDCPRFLAAWKKAKTGMAEGTFEVGTEVKPGTYETTAHLTGGRVDGCYWERGGSNGHIIANNFITATKKVRVTIRSSDEMFTSRGCGDWVRV